MTQGKPKRRIRNFLLDKRFQLKYTFAVVAVSAVISAGLGIALYGLGYFLFHDIMFHKRIPGVRIPVRGSYLRRIVHAHKVHHQTSNKKEGGTAFGFLYAGQQYDS